MQLILLKPGSLLPVHLAPGHSRWDIVQYICTWIYIYKPICPRVCPVYMSCTFPKHRFGVRGRTWAFPVSGNLEFFINCVKLDTLSSKMSPECKISVISVTPGADSFSCYTRLFKIKKESEEDYPQYFSIQIWTRTLEVITIFPFQLCFVNN